MIFSAPDRAAAGNYLVWITQILMFTFPKACSEDGKDRRLID
jgi:hypothetical protein